MSVLQYASAVARTTGSVLLGQLSRVFKSLRLPLLEDLVRPLDIVGDDLERLLISSSRLQRPALQVDRAGGYIVFGSPAVAVRVYAFVVVWCCAVWCGLVWVSAPGTTWMLVAVSSSSSCVLCFRAFLSPVPSAAAPVPR